MDIINNINNSNDILNTIKNLTPYKLEQAIIYASDKYYNNEPVITDAIFDTLRDYLYLLKPNSKVLKLIGAPVKNKVKLPYYLGSMDKIKPPSNKLNIWMKEYKAPYIVSDKLDGISALLLYKDNNIKLYTRGTATYGMDITKLLKYITIPSYENVINYLEKNNMGNFIAFRGELILSKNKFNKNWKDTMKNARNTVAGLVNSKNINPLLAIDTKLILYQIIEPNYKFSNQIKHIKNMSFNCVHNKKVKNISFEKLSSYLIKRRNKSKYEVDGIIVTNNEIHPINIEGNPKYAWAFKDVLENQKATSEIINIEWNITKDNNIIPTIIIKPINVGGVTIKRVTGNNARYMIDNNLGIGAIVEVIRSNDVIPKIINIIKSSKVILPNIEYEWDENNVHIKSITNTIDTDIKNIYYFFNSIGVIGLGEKIITKLYNNGFNTIKKILIANINDILNIPGFKQKSAENIINSIKKYTINIPLHILMKASNKLGRGMGEERAKDVLIHYPDIMNIYNKITINEFINMLKKIDGWEEKTSTIFASNFKNFIDFYNDISKYITINMKIENINGKLKNFKIVISGFRDKDIENKIIKNGGEISSNISKNTKILIIKNKNIINTSKVIKAKELGINIMTLDEFNHFLH